MVTKPIDTERRLVAILAADVEGYSRLMGADEVATLQALTERRAILDGLISAHRGRIANTAGDSILAEFVSVVDAVQCAVEAQAELAKANLGLSGSARGLLSGGARKELTEFAAVPVLFAVTAKARTGSSIFLTCWAPRSANAKGSIFLT